MKNIQHMIHEKFIGKRGSHPQPIGAFIGFRVGNQILVGWSRCNFKAGDKFDYDRGLTIAMENALGDKPLPAYDNDFCVAFEVFRYRCQKFFKGCTLGKASAPKIPADIFNRYFPYFKDMGVTEDEMRRYLEASVPLFEKLYTSNMSFPSIPPMSREDIDDIFAKGLIEDSVPNSTTGCAVLKVDSPSDSKRLLEYLERKGINVRVIKANTVQEAEEIYRRGNICKEISREISEIPEISAEATNGVLPHIYGKKNFHNLRDEKGKFRRKSIMDVAKNQLVTGQVVYRSTKNGRFCKGNNPKQGTFRTMAQA